MHGIAHGPVDRVLLGAVGVVELAFSALHIPVLRMQLEVEYARVVVLHWVLRSERAIIVFPALISLMHAVSSLVESRGGANGEIVVVVVVERVIIRSVSNQQTLQVILLVERAADALVPQLRVKHNLSLARLMPFFHHAGSRLLHGGGKLLRE